MGGVRLFTALWPPGEAVVGLGGALGGTAEGWRPTPPERWHVTLAFHGADDPVVRARDLDRRLCGAEAPRLRIAGAGTFPGVLWAGVETAAPEDDAALRALVAGASGDPDAFVAHLTLARSRHRRRARLPHLPPGPWWSPREVLLVASERADGELRYRPVHSVPLGP